MDMDMDMDMESKNSNSYPDHEVAGAIDKPGDASDGSRKLNDGAPVA